MIDNLAGILEGGKLGPLAKLKALAKNSGKVGKFERRGRGVYPNT